MADQMPIGKRGGGFPVTQWTAVELAGQNAAAAREALEHLLKQYLPALRAHLLYRRRLPPERADDLLQTFVTRSILEKHLLAHADRSRGRFRSFLLTALDHLVVNELEYEQARRRSAGKPVQELPDEVKDPASAGPAVEFDAAWARQVIDEALKRMRAECEYSGRRELWEILEGRVIRPMLAGAEAMAYEEMIQRFACSSPAQAYNLLATAKRMLQRTIRDVVGEYAGSEEEIDREIGELMIALGRAG